MKPIQINQVRYYPITMAYKTAFRASYGTETHKSAVIVEVISEAGISGWGEVSVEHRPAYGAETTVTACHILKDFLIPNFVGQTIDHPSSISRLIGHIHGHPHTRAGLEAAVWDCYARANQVRLLELFRGYLDLVDHDNETVMAGVVIGLSDSIDGLLDAIEHRLDEGYRTVKLKIVRHSGLEVAKAVRKYYPHLPLILDANGDFRSEDSVQLKELDALDVLMIEQPLAHDDFLGHSLLQRGMATPICLDESIRGVRDVQLAHHLGIARAINLKPARVGGFSEALEIHRSAQQHMLHLRAGGMLETGVGRAGLLALAALPAVTWPSDISATSRYFDADLTPPFELDQAGALQVAAGAGIGVDVDRDRLMSFVTGA